MGTTTDKLNRLTQTKSDLKTVINYAGGNIVDETTFKEYPKKLHKAYIDILNNGTDDLYEALPKITESGTELKLDDIEEGKMKMWLNAVNLEQNTKLLPDTYTQVDYIESSGTQYIDIGIKGTNDTRIKIALTMNSQASTVMPFGDFTDTSKAITCNIGASSSARSRWGSDTISQNFALNTNKIYNLDISEKGYYVNGTNKWTPTANTFTTNDNIHLFIANGSTSGLYGYIYSCEIYDNDVLIRNYVPCYRNSDNEVGMYDIINNVFYTNQGTGLFTYGSVMDVPNPYYPQDIHVITGSNNIKIQNKNVFDYNYFFDNYVTRSSSDVGRCVIQLKPNTDYTISTNLIGTGNALSYVFVISGDDTTFTPTTNNNGLYKDSPRTVTTDNDGYLTIGIYVSGTKQITINDFINDDAQVQIEEDSIASKYVLHQEQNYLITLSSKNLFNINGDINTRYNGQTGNYNTASGNDLTSTYTNNDGYPYGQRIYVGVGKTTTISARVKSFVPSNRVGSVGRILVFNDNTTSGLAYVNFDNDETGIKTLTFTSTTDYIYVAFSFIAPTSSQSSVTFTDIQVEYGDTATPYEPYIANPIEYCKIGNYSDQIFKNTTDSEFYDDTLVEGDWYLNKNIKKYTDGWRLGSQSFNDTLIFYGTTKDTITSTYTPYCTHLPYYRGIYSNDKVAIDRFINSQEIGIRLPITLVSDVADVENWINNNKVEIYYPTDNPTIIHITENNYPTLYQELEDIYNNAKSYEGTTHITQTNTDLPFNIEISALSKIE